MRPQTKQHVAFGLPMLASSAMNNVFVTYYMDMFTKVQGLSPAWFYLGQAGVSRG